MKIGLTVWESRPSPATETALTSFTGESRSEGGSGWIWICSMSDYGRRLRRGCSAVQCSTQYTVHSTQYTVHSIQYSVQYTVLSTSYRRPGCLSIEVERADPSGIMTYSEADPEADMQNVLFFFYPSMFFQSKMLPKTRKLWQKLICNKTALNTISHFWVIYDL